MIDSRLNVILCTNETVPVRLDSDDRRWFVVEVSSLHANSQSYFARLYDVINTPAAVEIFYLFLMTRDLETFNPRQIPTTLAKEDMQLAHRSTVLAFMQHLCFHPEALGLQETEGVPVPTADVYEAYKIYVDAQPSHVKRVEQRVMVKELKAVGLTNGSMTIRGVSCRGFKLPPRAALERTLRQGKMWDRDAE